MSPFQPSVTQRCLQCLPLECLQLHQPVVPIRLPVEHLLEPLINTFAQHSLNSSSTDCLLLRFHIPSILYRSPLSLLFSNILSFLYYLLPNLSFAKKEKHKLHVKKRFIISYLLVELGALLRVVGQQLTGGELLGTVGLSKSIHRLNETISAVLIHESEWTAPERGESNGEDTGNVAVALLTMVYYIALKMIGVPESE
jgi:hypothetical protein